MLHVLLSKTKSKGFKHKEPLIKDDIRKTGKASIQKTIEESEIFYEKSFFTAL